MKKFITYISSIFFSAIIISACNGYGSNGATSSEKKEIINETPGSSQNSGVDEFVCRQRKWTV